MRTPVFLALAAGLLPWLACDIGSEARRPSKPKTLTLPHDAPLALAPLLRPSLALAPDGAVLVYVAARDGETQLFEYPLDGRPARPIPGTEGATHPFYSHDGRWLGFVTERELKKISLGDGRIVTLHEVADPVGASFGPLGGIVFAHDMGRLLSLISAEGDEHRVVASRETYFWPHVLPSGDSCLVSRAEGGIAIVSLRAGIERQLLRDGEHPLYVAPGLLLFTRSGKAMAVPFDVHREEVRGEPFLVIDGVWTGLYGASQLAVSTQGRLIYASGGGAEEASFIWIDRNGQKTPLPLPRDIYGSFALSRDGAFLALEREGDRHDIWIYDLLTLNGARLTSEGNNGFPVWSSDGKWLVFTSDRSGSWNLYRRPVENGAAERLTRSELRQIPYSLSPDGEWLGFTEYASESRGDIWLLPMKGGKPRLFLGTRWHESQLVFSPDGKNVAYVSDASGDYEVYAARFTRPAESRKVSASGGEEPIWAPGGKELAYREGSRWMLVGIETEPEIRVGRRTFLFEGHVHTPGRSYDFAPDGESLLGIEPDDASLAFDLKIIDDFRKSVRGPSRP